MRRAALLPLIVVAALILAACAPPAPPLVFATSDSPAVESAWGTVVTLGDAPSVDAPVLVASESWITAAWSDGESILVTRRYPDGRFRAQTAITAPRAPYAVRIEAAPGGGFHLLWLDQIDDGTPRLFSALLDSELRVTLGADPISTVPTTRYTLHMSGGGLWVVWEGGHVAEPDLYAQWIDPLGRPRLPARLIGDAAHPVLVPLEDGSTRLYWLRGREIHAADFSADSLLTGDRIAGTAPAMTRTEYLHDFNVSHDRTHAYAFWNIVDAASGAGRSALAAVGLEADGRFSAPRGLSLRTGDEITLDTGFNTGRLRAVGSGPRPVMWAQPLAGQHATLPLVVYDGFVVTMLYLQNGAVVAAQSIAPLDGGGLLAPPFLATGRDRHLYLTWAQPLDGRPQAALRYVSTRFLFSE